MTIELRESAEGTGLTVQVVPRAGRTGIERVDGGALRVRIAAAPVEGAANQALIDFLAQLFDVPRRHVEIVSGAHTRRKVIRLRGLGRSAVEDVLTRAISGGAEPDQRRRSPS